MGFASLSNELNTSKSPWNQSCVFMHADWKPWLWDLRSVNKIYVPWKAKKAVISCFLTFIVYFTSAEAPCACAQSWGAAFCSVDFRFIKALFSLLHLPITSVKFIKAVTNFFLGLESEGTTTIGLLVKDLLAMTVH